jgi:hypothetical protein
MIKKFDYKKLAKNIFNEIQKLQVKNTPNLRRIQKRMLIGNDKLKYNTKISR